MTSLYVCMYDVVGYHSLDTLSVTEKGASSAPRSEAVTSTCHAHASYPPDATQLVRLVVGLCRSLTFGIADVHCIRPLPERCLHNPGLPAVV
jgi:hypothetical protein